MQVMTTIPLADAQARLSAVLDAVRDTHDRVVTTRNGRPEAVIMSASDLETPEEPWACCPRRARRMRSGRRRPRSPAAMQSARMSSGG